MTKTQLESVAAWFSEKPGRLRLLQFGNTFCVACAVCAFLERLVFHTDLRALGPSARFALTCGIPFVLLSAARSRLDMPRPYEVYDLQPLLPREGKGKSFPSRHVFSIFVIGTCLLYLLPGEGAVLLLLGVLLSLIRLLAGLHFERDVLAGAAIGILSGVVGYGLIP